jgi:hypothetical protein
MLHPLAGAYQQSFLPEVNAYDARLQLIFKIRVSLTKFLILTKKGGDFE